LYEKLRLSSHAHSHQFLQAMDAARQREEIVGSQNTFREELGHPVRSFVSRGGPAQGENPVIDQIVLEVGYQFVFSNFRIQRIRGDRV